MRSLKTTGGLTRGRGMTETQRNIWCMSGPIFAEVNEAMQQLTSIAYTTSEQHKDLTTSRQNRDSSDTYTLIKFLVSKNPFDKEANLQNIVTGEIAAKQVNVTRAEEIGKDVLNRMSGKQVSKYTFRKKHRAITMDSPSKVKIDDEEVNIDPQLLFQRLILVAAQKDKLEEAFCHELCGFPPALFEKQDVLLKANKPILANAIWDLASAISDKEIEQLVSHSVKHVIDGGALLHKIPWDKGHTYKTICQRYVAYIWSKYERPIVVFDGYEGGPAPKDGTRSHGIKDTHIKPFVKDMLHTSGQNMKGPLLSLMDMRKVQLQRMAQDPMG